MSSSSNNRNRNNNLSIGGMMFYRVSDVKRKKDRIYNVKKINYISRNKNKIRIHYNIWTDVLKSETEEEAIDFMDNIHKQLNKKGIFRRLLDFLL